MNTNNQRCTRCVMDTTDPEIVFDRDGVCNHCLEFDNHTRKRWFPNDEGASILSKLFEKIKRQGEGREYDCIIGLSGGIDSSYLALVLKDYGLRPLVVHVDAGWNSELAVHNIERVVKYCGYDLHTHVLDWQEVKDLQLAYLKAGVANQDVVQDHAFFASLYRFAIRNKIKYVISGGNIATESIFPMAWHHSAMDAINLRSIHKNYGSRKLRDYKTISFLDYYLFFPFWYGMRVVRPLNFMPYVKRDAQKILKERVGFKDYGGKHGESRFTKFFQNYYLPTKFNMDKRLPHLSSLILSGEITRDQAIAELSKPLYCQDELKDDLSFVAKKLGLTADEFSALVVAPSQDYRKFSNWDSRFAVLRMAKNIASKVLGSRLRSYS